MPPAREGMACCQLPQYSDFQIYTKMPQDGILFAHANAANGKRSLASDHTRQENQAASSKAMYFIRDGRPYVLPYVLVPV